MPEPDLDFNVSREWKVYTPINDKVVSVYADTHHIDGEGQLTFYDPTPDPDPILTIAAGSWSYIYLATHNPWNKADQPC